MIDKLLALPALLLTAALALAQTPPYPSQPIKWIVPYAAGGSVDSFVRVLGEAMQTPLGQPIVVENRPGGSTNIAVSALLQSKPDGYTLMQAENAALFFNEHLLARPQFRPETDFAYVSAIGRFPVMLVVAAELPVRSIGEFIAYAKANPDQVNYASPGIGTTHHVAMELFKQRAGLRIEHVPYRGGALAVQDVVGGRVSAMMVEPTVAQQYIRQGRLRPLAVSSSQRLAGFPEVPTFAESGQPDVVAYTLHGLVARPGIPGDVVERLHAQVKAALQQPKVIAFLEGSGFEVVSTTPQGFKEMARTESARWGRVIGEAGIHLD